MTMNRRATVIRRYETVPCNTVKPVTMYEVREEGTGDVYHLSYRNVGRGGWCAPAKPGDRGTLHYSAFGGPSGWGMGHGLELDPEEVIAEDVCQAVPAATVSAAG